MSGFDEKIPLPDDMHHFSAIRIGDSWLYNGANGDAFSFSSIKPVMTPAASEPFLFSRLLGPRAGNRVSLPSCMPSSASVASGAGSRVSLPSCTPSSASVASGSESYSTPDSTPPASRRSSVYTRGQSPSYTSSGQSQRISPASSPGFGKKEPPKFPEAYGLPPILPRPPAADHPPPLPSRPASSVRMAPTSSSNASTSSMSSRRSSVAPDERGTAPLSVDTALDWEEGACSSLASPSFFRSSGTITVEASIKSCHRQMSQESPRGSPTPRHNSGGAASDMATPTQRSPDSGFGESPTTSQTQFQDGKSPSPTPKVPKSTSRLSMAISHTTALASTPATLARMGSPAASRGQRSPSSGGQRAEVASCDASDTAYESASDESVLEDGEPGFRREALPASVTATSATKSFFPRWRRHRKGGGGSKEPSSSIDVDDSEANLSGKNSNKTIQGPIPPELGSIRNRSLNIADVVTNALVIYKASKSSRGQKKKGPPKVRLVKAAKCRQCTKSFGLRCFRYHCSRCKAAFCGRCIPREIYQSEAEKQRAALTRVCAECSRELAQENARGQTRGLWTEFERYRAEARDNRGLDVITSAKDRQQLEVQNLIDMVPRLRSVCMKFLVDMSEELQRTQHRYNFITNYLQFENPSNLQSKYKGAKTKQCTKCQRQLRMLTEIRGCAVCAQAFCKLCTYLTLQLYLPSDTDRGSEVTLESVRFHIKEDEMDEVSAAEMSETYYMCTACEDVVARNLLILEFNTKIPDLEQELFDLQRQIEHSLTYGPFMQKSVSVSNLSTLDDTDVMGTNIKIANKMYDRYMRAYDILDHLQPQTGGQKMLHRHIKQAMYDFYIKRRDQLNTTLRRRDSWDNLASDFS